MLDPKNLDLTISHVQEKMGLANMAGIKELGLDS
jgi:hypothetical protein